MIKYDSLDDWENCEGECPGKLKGFKCDKNCPYWAECWELDEYGEEEKENS